MNKFDQLVGIQLQEKVLKEKKGKEDETKNEDNNNNENALSEKAKLFNAMVAEKVADIENPKQRARGGSI